MASKKQSITGICMKVFILIELALYLGFLWLDITGGSTRISTSFKFLGIVLCFLWSVFRLVYNQANQDSVLVSAALLFTVCADTCLLLSNHFTLGLVFFSVVQLIYLYRIHCIGKTPWKRHLLQRGGIIALLVTLIIVMEVQYDMLLLLTIFYFVNICFNVWDSQKVRMSIWQENPYWNRYCVGMVLFLLCDINVGLFNMTSYVAIGNFLYHLLYTVASVAMWFFYLPAQVLISLSGGVEK